MIRESWRDKGYRNIHWCNKGNFHRGHTNIILCGEKLKTFPLKLGAEQGFFTVYKFVKYGPWNVS